MGLTSLLFKMARLSADARAISKGPGAIAKRAVRKTTIKNVAKTGVFRWPK